MQDKAEVFSGRAQVLFNIAPVSYTSACTHASISAIRNSVVPPGITVPTHVDPPPLVRLALGTSPS